MSIEELENAVASLPPEELSRFRTWFAEFDAAAWDQQIAEDAAAGRLDNLADAALRADDAGETTEL